MPTKPPHVLDNDDGRAAASLDSIAEDVTLDPSQASEMALLLKKSSPQGDTNNLIQRTPLSSPARHTAEVEPLPPPPSSKPASNGKLDAKSPSKGALDTKPKSPSKGALDAKLKSPSKGDLDVKKKKDAPPDPYTGRLLNNRFLLKKKLGQGGMGAVFLAEDKQSQEDVAVKVLPFQLSTDEKVLQRFRRESHVQLSLQHPHIVRTVAAGQEDEIGCFLAMELLRGLDLKEHTTKINRRRMTPPEILTFYTQLCDALAYTHKRGIVHRDLKPANVFLRDNPKNPLDDICLIDFGIAKLSDEDAAQLTVTGMFLGTPTYMSPEQAAGQSDIDPRSDIYSVGIMLYESLTGLTPFLGDNMVKILMDHLYTQPSTLAQLRPEFSFPPGLQKLLDRMLAKTRDKRPSAIDEIAQELQYVLRGLESFERGAVTSSQVPAETPATEEVKQNFQPETLRQDAAKLLHQLKQPELPASLFPNEELFARLAKLLRHCEEPPQKLPQVMMELLLEDYAKKPQDAESAKHDGAAPTPQDANALPIGQHTIGRLDILRVPQETLSPKTDPLDKKKPQTPAQEAILSLSELSQRHPSMSLLLDEQGRSKVSQMSPQERATYQRRQPQFKLAENSEKPTRSRSWLWLLLLLVGALAAISWFLIQRSSNASPAAPESHLFSPKSPQHHTKIASKKVQNVASISYLPQDNALFAPSSPIRLLNARLSVPRSDG